MRRRELLVGAIGLACAPAWAGRHRVLALADADGEPIVDAVEATLGPVLREVRRGVGVVIAVGDGAVARAARELPGVPRVDVATAAPTPGASWVGLRPDPAVSAARLRAIFPDLRRIVGVRRPDDAAWWDAAGVDAVEVGEPAEAADVILERAAELDATWLPWDPALWAAEADAVRIVYTVAAMARLPVIGADRAAIGGDIGPVVVVDAAVEAVGVAAGKLARDLLGGGPLAIGYAAPSVCASWAWCRSRDVTADRLRQLDALVR